VASDVHETSASGTQGSVQLIDLAEGEQEAPFAVREADGSAGAAPGRMPSRAEILAWLEEHPVVVGVATGVLCFLVIAGAMTAVLGSDSRTDADDPVAGAALSETEGGQGSFSSSGSGGANFTSDESKLSRTGAGKVANGETAAGASTSPKSPTARNSLSDGATTGGASNLDQSATINGGPPGSGSGQSSGPLSNTTLPTGTNPNGSPTTGASSAATGSTATTLNPGPNVSGPIPTTSTTSRVTTSSPATNLTTTVQTQSTPAPTTPTSAVTTPTTAPSTDLSIAAPGDGTRHRFETPTDFAANLVTGATQYCWTFIQSGVTALNQCSGGTTYQLPARPAGLDPGLVTVRATATGPSGTVSDTIQISLYRTQFISNPTRDVEIGRGALRVGVIDMIGATNYCFQITQAGYDSGPLCYNDPGNSFTKNDPIWDFLSPGPLTVNATVSGGGFVLATGSVTINLLAP